jgi:hypothetical protein
MDTKRTGSFVIFSGPSRDRLFDACKYAYDGEDANVTVNFGVAIGYTMPPGHPGCAFVPMTIDNIVIAGIEHEVAPGRSFKLNGHCTAALDITGKELDNYFFTACYNTKNRSGTISFYK